MQPTQGVISGLMKKVIFRPATKHLLLQGLWSRLHTLATFGMNYGGGGLFETSGELWVLKNVVGRMLDGIGSPVIFDVGANIGDYSLCVRRRLPAARVYAFEPAKSVYEEMVRRVAGAGEHDHIKTYEIGLSDSERKVQLHHYKADGRENTQLSSIDARRSTQVVDVQPHFLEPIRVQDLDGFCASEGIGRIDFLKMDVEGHELSILRGASRMLNEGAISIIQFEFGQNNIYSRTFFYDFWSMLCGEFDVFRIVPEGIVPIRYYGEHLEIFLLTNYLAIRRQRVVGDAGAAGDRGERREVGVDAIGNTI